MAQPSQGVPVSSPQSAQTPVAPATAPVKPKKDKKIPYLLVVGLLIFILLLVFANQVVPRVLMYFTRAANSPGNYSLANSYVFGSPLVAKANGQDKIRVTAFLLDDKGRGVPDNQISLNIVPKGQAKGSLPTVTGVAPTTDDFGRAVFEITSTATGQFVVTASISGLEFPQAATLTFN